MLLIFTAVLEHIFFLNILYLIYIVAKYMKTVIFEIYVKKIKTEGQNIVKVIPGVQRKIQKYQS